MRLLLARLLLARLLLALLPLAIASCFSPDTPVCVFSCAQAPHECPSGYECRNDMYCHKVGTSGLCPGFALPDAPGDGPMSMDGPPDGSIDGPIDAPIDAAIDAAIDAPEID